MPHYKSPDNKVHFLESSAFQHLLPAGCVQITDDEAEALLIVAPSLSDFQSAHDAHLNLAARARKYDSIHTASLRAAYPGPWHDEGVAFATWMDACNVAGYAVLADVEAGNRPVPTIAEYLSELPALVLPWQTTT